MRLISSILALLLIVAACIVAIFVVAEPTASTGLAHPSIAAMRVGGDGLTRFTPVSTIILIMQSAIFAMFGLLLYLGISKHRRTRQCKIWITAGTVSLLMVWWFIFGTYSGYLTSGQPRMVFGFPLPTAITVYGLWLAGFVFVIAYVVGFRSFIFTKEDEAAYHELLKNHKHDRDAI